MIANNFILISKKYKKYLFFRKAIEVSSYISHYLGGFCQSGRVFSFYFLSSIVHPRLAEIDLNKAVIIHAMRRNFSIKNDIR